MALCSQCLRLDSWAAEVLANISAMRNDLSYTRQMDDAVLLDRLKQSLSRYAGEEVACVYLFGSAARGEARAGSDVDLAVLYHPEPAPALTVGSVLACELERALRQTVDLVIANFAPPDLVHRILRDGELVFERDASARIQFEVRARNEYFDVLPYLLEYRQASSKRARGRVSK